MSDNYYDNSSNWVFDGDGNYLYTKRRGYDPNIERNGYWYTNQKEWDEKHQLYLREESNKEFESMWKSLENDIKSVDGEKKW